MIIMIKTGEGEIEDKEREEVEREEKNKSLLSMIEEREETEGLTLSLWKILFTPN